MKNIKFLVLALLSLGVLFSSCRKDQDFIVDEIILNENEILGSLTGQVFDENNVPIVNASVFLNDEMQTTDEYGFFLFKDKAIQSAGTVVKVQASSYIEVSKIVNPKANAKTIVNIKLLEKKLTAIIDATTGGQVEINKGALTGQIDFEENAFVLKGSNTAYIGKVQVYANIINPANDEDILVIPGDLRGLNSNKETVQLASYSMLSVLIETSDGQALDLADGKEALVSFPVDPSIQANAPPTIPLWHYNIETGHWEEEGSAELIDNHYVGKVSHFSYWNCDVPFPLVQISGRLIDENGNPLQGVSISINIVESGLSRNGITNTSGEFSGGVPRDENLEITFSMLQKCTIFSLTHSLGSFSSETILDDIILNGTYLYTITGRTVSCEGEATESRFIISSDEGNIFGYTNEDGFFSIPICYENFSLTGVDYTNNIKSESLNFESITHEDINIGDLLLCNKLDTYITMNYNGILIREEDTFGQLSMDFLNLSNENEDSLGNSIRLGINLDLNEEIIGQHEDEYFYFYGFDENREWLFLGCSENDQSGSCHITINITTAQPSGGYIIGTYEGTAINRRTEETGLPVSGSFKVLSTL